MRTRIAWAGAGVAAAAAGVAAGELAARALDVRASPVIAVAEQVVSHLPGWAIESGIQRLQHHDKPVMIVIVLVLLGVLSAGLGLLGRRWWWVPLLGFAVIAAFVAVCVAADDGGGRGEIAVGLGFVVWIGGYTVVTDPGRTLESEAEASRRMLLRGGIVAGLGVVGAVISPMINKGRRAVEEARSALALPGVTAPVVPAGADLGAGGEPWLTPTRSFYRIDTAFLPPAVDPSSWHVRIHGMVDRELVLSLDDLLARERTEAWITLNCVSNEVGGDLIGNGWWSGVRLAPLLAEAGIQAGADAVLQTSSDGWTCGTPLTTLTDDRNAMLAVALNGEPLPINHGFPVRTIVPGLYGYVSACKWVVDLEVTTMDKAVGYWVPLGWSAQGPVKLASRIDRPRDGAKVVEGQPYTVAGTAWQQEVGIAKVEVSMDGGPWQEATLGRVPNVDTWVQWKLDLSPAVGKHELRVRAVSKSGEVQTAVRVPPAPDGATGWDSVRFESVYGSD